MAASAAQRYDMTLATSEDNDLPPVPGVLDEMRIAAEQAAARPLPTAHTIWELVHHISAWQRIALQRIKGEAKPEVLPEDNFPPVADASEAAWQTSRAELEATNEALREALEAIVKDGKMYVQAGAGIVADSVPENEHQECVNKAKALFRAADEAVRFAGRAGRAQ